MDILHPMIARQLLPLTVAFTVVSAPSIAVTEQLKASKPPTVHGPLSTSPELRGCKKNTKRTDSGQVMARFHVCSRYYKFASDRENDSDSNYGAFWIQATVDTTNGWCASKSTVDLSYPRGVRNKAPRPGTTERAKQRERFTTKLIVDADGHAEVDGTIKSSFALLPGKLRSVFFAGRKLFRVRWNGGSKNKVALVSGLELSWPQGGQAPEITPRVGAVLDRTSC
jgi:hypothetical protein